MDKAKRDGLEKLKEGLLLAAEDMEQAHRAATALREDTSTDEAWRRALETAMAVAYMRPFTKGGWTLPAKFRPTSQLGRDLHRDLKDLRNKVYAHSDLTSGRAGSIKTMGTSGDVVSMEYRMAWQGLRRREPPRRAGRLLRPAGAVPERGRRDPRPTGERRRERLGTDRALPSSPTPLVPVGAPRFELGTSSPPD